MRLNRLVVPLALVAVLVLVTGAAYAAAQCSQAGADGQMGCGMKMGGCMCHMMGGHGMGMGNDVIMMGPLGIMMRHGMMRGGHRMMTKEGEAGTEGQGMMKGGCGMHGMGSCPMIRALLRAKTRGLWAGEAVVIVTPHGLLLIVTDVSHHGDANASVSVCGKGAEGRVSLAAERMGAGRFMIRGELEAVEQLTVHISHPGTADETVTYNLMPMRSDWSHCKMMAVSDAAQ